MSQDDMRRAVIEELANIAPEADAAAIAPDDDLRETLDLDSMDFLNFIIALHTRLAVEIPEPDYPKLRTIAGAVAYLSAKVGSRQ